jgi:hypothetical protein
MTDRVRAVLTVRALSHDVITFKALANAVGHVGPLHHLASILDKIHKEEGPSLAALVLADDPKPRGWINRKTWVRQRKAVYAFYGNRTRK